MVPPSAKTPHHPGRIPPQCSTPRGACDEKRWLRRPDGSQLEASASTVINDGLGPRRRPDSQENRLYPHRFGVVAYSSGAIVSRRKVGAGCQWGLRRYQCELCSYTRLETQPLGVVFLVVKKCTFARLTLSCSLPYHLNSEITPSNTARCAPRSPTGDPLILKHSTSSLKN